MDLMIGPGRSGAPSARVEDELLDGARLYAEPSLTGLNSQPVDDHAAFALLGARASEGPCGVDLQELTLRLLHSGSVALVRGAANYVFLDGLVLDDPAQPFGAQRFAQRFAGVFEGRVRTITRVFTISDRRLKIDDRQAAISDRQSTWTVRDYVDDRHGGGRVGTETCPTGMTGTGVRPTGMTDEGVRPTATTGTESCPTRLIAEQELPGEHVLAHPNGVGVLYKAQLGYRRLERIFATVERLQSGVNAKTIVSGYLGNVDQAHEELRRPDADVALFPTGASINRVASTAAIDQLMREFDTLLPLYLRRLHIVDAGSDPRMSGVSRRLALAPMLAFVDRVRAQISAVLERLGCDVQFERLRLESIEERTQKYGLLKLMQGDGVLSPTQFAAQAGALLEG